MTVDEFARLCRELRELGAVTVVADDMSATFAAPTPQIRSMRDVTASLDTRASILEAITDD